MAKISRFRFHLFGCTLRLLALKPARRATSVAGRKSPLLRMSRLAFWFSALNSFLDDERPQDVLATDPERVIAAAKDEMAESQVG